MMLLIFTHKVTHRIRYIFQLMVGQLLGIPFELTTDADAFRSYQGPKMSYTRAPLGDELFVSCAGLLFQRGIEGQELSFIDFEDGKAFYPAVSKASALPFDLFSAAFFLVSRYEEYLPYKLDELDRFNALHSISHQRGFLYKPVVNHWASALGRLLQQRFPYLSLAERKYRFMPTIDIDAAWQFREKGFIRSAGGFLRSAYHGEFEEFYQRTKVLLRVIKDPFDTYEEQFRILGEFGLHPIYFILFGDYGLNDKNIPVNNNPFHVLIKTIADYAEIGIHASFRSSYEGMALKKEIDGLSKVIHKDITRSRQHYLRLNLPFMYRNLAEMNITEDYSMGYNRQHGFRAGIADPFYFYDLDHDMPTGIKVFPFAFSINKFWKPDSEENLDLIRRIIEEVKKVDGTLVAAWDNEALSSYRTGPWQENFRQVLEMAKE